MKKIISLLLALVVIMSIMSLAACGSEKKADDTSIEGTWEVSHIESEGSEYSVEEWYDTEEDNYSNYLFVFKKGGKAFVYDGEDDDTVDWLQSGDSIMIGKEKCKFKDGIIKVEFIDDVFVCFKKTSDSQTIPEKDKLKKYNKITCKELLNDLEDAIEHYEYALEDYQEEPTEDNKDYVDYALEDIEECKEEIEKAKDKITDKEYLKEFEKKYEDLLAKIAQ